ncbi:MAG: hypothetical protein LBS11_05080 [Oscillospiraceae bacterium]|nr:hypothetical protein [Oscillospiraceae bacterium]
MKVAPVDAPCYAAHPTPAAYRRFVNAVCDLDIVKRFAAYAAAALREIFIRQIIFGHDDACFCVAAIGHARASIVINVDLAAYAGAPRVLHPFIIFAFNLAAVHALIEQDFRPVPISLNNPSYARAYRTFYGAGIAAVNKLSRLRAGYLIDDACGRHFATYIAFIDAVLYKQVVALIVTNYASHKKILIINGRV